MSDLQVLTYAEVCDTRTSEDWIGRANDLHGTVVLELSDGRIRCSVRQALINLMCWQLLLAMGIPIRKDHFIRRQPLSRSKLSSCLTSYYNEVVDKGLSVDVFKHELYRLYERFYGFTTNQLQRCAATMDIIRLANLANEPKMREVTDARFKVGIEMGTAAIEKQGNLACKKIMNLLRAEPGTEEGLEEDLLHSLASLGMLNTMQVAQVMNQYGIRTDVDDTIIPVPVHGNAVSGLRNAVEYACESLSAKKPAFYNHGAIKSAQYFGRMQHITASSVSKLYDGDCGSTVTVDFKVTESNYGETLGKYIVTDRGLTVIDRHNVKSFIGQTVKLRSAMTCKHKDGICEVCAGRLAAAISRRLNIGIVAAIQVVAAATQKILGAKHLNNTVSITYEIPELTDAVVQYLSSNSLTWNTNIKDIDKYTMGIPLEYFARFDTVPTLQDKDAISAENMSSIYDFVLRDTEGKETIYPAVSSDGNIPFLSREMLLYIRDVYNECVRDDTYVWIPLKGTKFMPIFGTTVLNDNMLLYVRNITSFFSGPIRDIHSCAEALERLSNLVHSKVTVNITWIDIMLKAYLITKGYDTRIPVVTDPNNVNFGNVSFIITNRTVGGELAYEKHKEYIVKPQTYVVPKQQSMFDLFTIGNKL